jgi:sugar-specific transcriptional regulator TrmB
MSDSQTLKNLLEFGLSDKEARVYLASLALGPAVAQAIAAKAGINRPTAYLMIESLQRRGLMSVMQKGKRRHFVAGNPNHLRYLVAQEKRAVDEREKAVEEIIKDIDQVRVHDEGEIEVEVLEGMEATRRIQEHALRTSGTVRELCNIALVRRHLPPQFEGDRRKEIVKRNNVLGVYANADQLEREVSAVSRKVGADRKIVAGLNTIDDTAYLTVYGGKSKKTLIIKNIEILTTLNALFDALRDESQPFTDSTT